MKKLTFYAPNSKSITTDNYDIRNGFGGHKQAVHKTEDGRLLYKFVPNDFTGE